jgi:hypothetical protein
VPGALLDILDVGKGLGCDHDLKQGGRVLRSGYGRKPEDVAQGLKRRFASDARWAL